MAPIIPRQSPLVPDHTEGTVRAIAELRANHHDNATLPQRTIDRVTCQLARPGFVGWLTGMVFGWMALNLLAAGLGFQPADPPPFPWLGGAVALVSLIMVALVLGTQRREDQLAEHRELLLMELAILSEQKIAKVIQLLEESRRDNPLILNRVDREAEAMGQPADPKSVLDVINETHVSALT